MGHNDAARCRLKGTGEDDFRITHRPGDSALGNVDYAKYFVCPVDQQKLELLNKLNLVFIPCLPENAFGVRRACDLGPHGCLYFGPVRELDLGYFKMLFFARAFHNRKNLNYGALQAEGAGVSKGNGINSKCNKAAGSTNFMP